MDERTEQQRSPRLVTLSGYRSGRYVVIDEEEDGTLRITPLREPQPAAATTGKRILGGVLGTLFTKPQEHASAEAMVSDWGVTFRRDEEVVAFELADVNGAPRFVAVTGLRLILAPDGGAQLAVHDRARLDIKLTALRRRPGLRITASGEEIIVGGERGAVTRIAAALGIDANDG